VGVVTLEEAQTVLRIVKLADNGCSRCVNELVEQLIKAFPEFTWEQDEDSYEWSVR